MQIKMEARMLGKRLKGIKNAELTVEIGLSLALTIVALFLVLGLFSQNLKSMVDASGMKKNLFNKNTIAKTTYDNHSVDYTASQVNVEVVADQGLDWYLTNAQERIDNYLQTPPATPSEISDFAKAETIKTVNDVSSITSKENDLINALNISINPLKGQTIIGEKVIKYTHVDVADSTLSLVQEINRKKF